MRLTQTIILRILIDSETPEELRGTLRSISSDQEHTFANEQSLLECLRQICQETHFAPNFSDLAPDG